METLNKFKSILGPHRGKYLRLLLFTSFLSAVMSALNPLILKYLFDEGVIKRDFGLFIGLAVGFIMLATVWRFLGLKLSLAVQRLRHSVLRSLSALQLERYYSIPYGEVIARPKGYYSSRIYDEPYAAANSAVDLGFDLTSAVINSAASFAVIVFISPKATAALALTVPALMILSRRYAGRIKRHSKEEKEEEGLLRSVVARAADAYRSVRVFGLGAAAAGKMSGQTERFIGSQYMRFRQSALYGTLSSVSASYVETLVMIVCGYEMLKGNMTFGGFMGFMNAFWIAMGGIRSVINKVPEISKTEALLDRIAEFAPASPPAPGKHSDSIALSGVGFGYGNSTVLRDLDLSVAKGEKVLLSGGNGCGKSTLANMISGFLHPTAGEMTSFPLERISACVSPHGFIPGTLRDNLDYAALDETRRKYADALLAELDMKPQLDKDSEEMSAGQKKKAEVLMGLLKEADLYIFDEPLANVDAESKKKIMDRIFERAAGATLVVIMHGDDEFRSGFDRAVALPSAADAAAA